MSLCFKFKFARFADLAELNIGAVIKAFLYFLVRNVWNTQKHVPEFSFHVAYFCVKFFDAIRKLLHFLEKLRYILTLFLEFRHLARSHVLFVLERFNFSQKAPSLYVKFFDSVKPEVALAASFNSGLHAFKVFSDPFDIQHCLSSCKL